MQIIIRILRFTKLLQAKTNNQQLSQRSAVMLCWVEPDSSQLYDSHHTAAVKLMNCSHCVGEINLEKLTLTRDDLKKISAHNQRVGQCAWKLRGKIEGDAMCRLSSWEFELRRNLPVKVNSELCEVNDVDSCTNRVTHEATVKIETMSPFLFLFIYYHFIICWRCAATRAVPHQHLANIRSRHRHKIHNNF